MIKIHKNDISAYLWLVPSLLLMSVMIAVPVFTVFKMSMVEISKSGVIKSFNNFENFKNVFASAAFRKTLANTLIWTVSVVGISTVLGIIIGLVLNLDFPGRKIMRAIVVFPWATSLVIQALIWKYILSAEYGSLNVILYKIGVISSYKNWTPTASAFFAWECWVGIFVTVPFVTFCVLSGLQSIDNSYYESAEVDGASFFKKLFTITLPLLKKNLTVSTVLNIIYVFNSFPIIWTITKGDPADQTHTIATYIYDLAFYNRKSGDAAAVSVIGFVILCIFATAYMMMTIRSEKEEDI
ncbi:MAG: sugar ABC transporter permease [Sphaerochaetaceae bacterium]|nr:sugar ABC transporter permease [Sphaerochaetaceae bacterium]